MHKEYEKMQERIAAGIEWAASTPVDDNPAIGRIYTLGSGMICPRQNLFVIDIVDNTDVVCFAVRNHRRVHGEWDILVNSWQGDLYITVYDTVVIPLDAFLEKANMRPLVTIKTDSELFKGISGLSLAFITDGEDEYKKLVNVGTHKHDFVDDQEETEWTLDQIYNHHREDDTGEYRGDFDDETGAFVRGDAVINGIFYSGSWDADGLFTGTVENGKGAT